MASIFFLLPLVVVLLSGCSVCDVRVAAAVSNAYATRSVPVWHMRAASLFQVTSPADSTASGSSNPPAPLDVANGQYATENCHLNEAADVYNDEVVEELRTGASETDVFRRSETLVPLYEYLWGSMATNNSLPDGATAAATADGASARGTVVAGTLDFGPFHGELVQTSAGPSIIAPTDDGDETDSTFMLSIFLGEATDSLCFDVSLYRSLDDVGSLTKAIMTWTSSSYTSSCEMRLSSYMERELNLSTPTYYYSRKPSQEEESFHPGHSNDRQSAAKRELSPWLRACKLATVDRFSYVFVPSAILASDSFCHYTDEESGSSSLAPGQRREVQCSVVLGVQFRPTVQAIPEREKRLAVLKIAAGLTKLPSSRSSATEDNNITKTLPGAGQARRDSAPSLSSSASSEEKEDSRLDDVSHAAKEASLQVSSGAPDGEPDPKESGSDKADVTDYGDKGPSTGVPVGRVVGVRGAPRTEPLFVSGSLLTSRCTQLSLTAKFWNVTSKVCHPEVVIMPEEIAVKIVEKGQDWLTVLMLVMSGALSLVLGFYVTRLSVLHTTRRNRFRRH